MPSKNNYRTPCSLFFLPMDSSFPSKEDYAERIAAISNKIDVEMSNSVTVTSSDPVHQLPHVYNEAAPITSS